MAIDNSLDLVLGLTIIPNTTTQRTLADARLNLTDIVLSSSRMLTLLRLLDVAQADGQTVPVSFNLTDGILALRFPCFNSSLLYDPDFSVVLTQNTENSGGSDGLQLLALLALLVIPLALVLIAVIVAAIAWFLAKRRVNQTRSINYGGDTNTEGL